MLYEISSLKKIYNKRTVLDITHLQIEEGRRYSLLGANGSGKTTLLNILAFLDKQSSGQVAFRSRKISSSSDLTSLRRQVVMVDQYPILFSESVYKNLEFGLKVRRIEKKKRQALIGEALEMVGMQDFIHAKAPSLSGGETKRVALARSLVVKPAVLLCDEPTANVDIENQEIIFRILRDINKQYGISVIFSTHNWLQAEQLAHHTLHLHEGRISEALIANIFYAEICPENEGRQLAIINKDVMLELPKGLLSGHEREGTSVRVYIDPAKIVMSRLCSEEKKPGLVRGEIKRVVKKNSQIQFDIDLGCNMSVSVPEQVYRNDPPLVGEKVELLVPANAVSIIP